MMNVPSGTKFVRFMIRTLYVLATLAMMAMMSIIVANIIGRVFFKSPVTGMFEIAGFAGVIVAAVAIGLTEHERRNIAVDFVARRFAPGLRSVVDRFTFFLSLGAVGVLLWAVVKSAIESIMTKEITLVLNIRVFPFRFIWAAGLLFLCGLLLLHLVGASQRRLKK
jgi:TRAP-type C4-dicarboxylate transport system permease small subunit